jgi:HKD family nuclease
MFARIVKSNLKSNRVTEFNQKFEQQIVPMLRKAKGFRDAITLVGAGGTDITSLTLWDLKEDAESYNSTTYPEVLKALSTVLEGSPQVKTYEVTTSTFTKVSTPAAV